MRMSRIFRGEIYLADLGPIVSLPSGQPSIEIAKRRPVIVVSVDALNRVSENRPFYVVVVPGTTGTSSFRDRRTNVRLLPAETGLRDEGVFLAHQIRSVDVRRLSQTPIGRVRGKAFDRVEAAIRYVLEPAD
jgi:mRNA-degrading endonuclease toxin of MazEF toxin-antitoxin module